jgi:hypothetical protein
MATVSEGTDEISARLAATNWCARVDGEIVFQVTGPDAEALRSAVEGPVVAYRMPERPTADNGWQLNGSGSTSSRRGQRAMRCGARWGAPSEVPGPVLMSICA